MNPYQHYSVPDFMRDPGFRAWVLDNDPVACTRWEEWLTAYPAQQAQALQARELLIELRDGFNELSETELESRVQHIIQSLASRTADTSQSVFPMARSAPYLKMWAMAACLVLALLLGWYLVERPATIAPSSAYQQLVQRAGATAREVSNTSDKQMQIRLPDGSQVILAPQSRLSYDTRLGPQPQRQVYLTGEAFFSVKRDPAQPFLVYANGIVTKVLGTSFSIKAYENGSDVTVAVRSGRVSVFSPGPLSAKSEGRSVFDSLSAGIMLTANQQATYQVASDRLVKSIVDHPVLTRPEAISPQTVFTDAPVSQIFDQLEQAYSITIVYDKAEFAHCLLTARLSDESLQDKIKLICASIGASYEVIDAQIIVTGAGCK